MPPPRREPWAFERDSSSTGGRPFSRPFCLCRTIGIPSCHHPRKRMMTIFRGAGRRSTTATPEGTLQVANLHGQAGWVTAQASAARAKWPCLASAERLTKLSKRDHTHQTRSGAQDNSTGPDVRYLPKWRSNEFGERHPADPGSRGCSRSMRRRFPPWSNARLPHLGAADAERDVRGFALKFYTEEGNWDLVGNNSQKS